MLRTGRMFAARGTRCFAGTPVFLKKSNSTDPTAFTTPSSSCEGPMSSSSVQPVQTPQPTNSSENEVNELKTTVKSLSAHIDILVGCVQESRFADEDLGDAKKYFVDLPPSDNVARTVIANLKKQRENVMEQRLEALEQQTLAMDGSKLIALGDVFDVFKMPDTLNEEEFRLRVLCLLYLILLFCVCSAIGKGVASFLIFLIECVLRRK